MSRRKPPPVEAVPPPQAQDPRAVPEGSSTGTHSVRRPIFEIVPSWVSALTGVVALILVIVGYNAVAGPPTRSPAAHVQAMQYDETGFTALGDYAAIRSGEDEVVLLGRPAVETDGPWAHAEARLTPTVQDTRTGTEDGEFEATMPVDTLGEVWRVRVLVVEGGLSGLEPWTELTDLGADCSCVLYAGEEVLLSPSPEP